MPTTSNGDTVYADPTAMEAYAQQDNDTFSLSDSFDDPTDWRTFLEARQVEAKARIDQYTGRDFEDHAGDTVTFDVGPTSRRILDLPTPVRNVTEVRVDGEVIPTDEYVVRDESQLIRLDPDTDAVSDALPDYDDYAIDTPDGHWPAGYDNVAVDLDWGYQTPPPDVAEAEMKLVNNTLSGLAQMREGVIVQQDDVDVTVNLPSAMTSEVRGMLKAHRDTGRMAGVI